MSSDLHTHTSFSDGKLAPEELVAAAKDARLKYIGITDHDTIEAVSHLYENGLYPNRGINIIPGVEFSAYDPTREVHIIGYNVDIYHRELGDKLNDAAEARWTRFSEMIAKLRELGYDISEADVLTVAGASKSISRSHVARALVKKGLFPSVREAFGKMLETGKPAYVPHYRLQIDEIIALIKKAGGTAVIAHPKLVRDDEFVLSLVERGIDGIEVFYPQHDENDVARYMKMAEDNNLLVAGGSDYHGFTSRHPVELGEFTIEDKWAEKFFHPNS